MNNQKAHELVSVIIPFYNSSKTILETLQSVEKQTYPAIEIIVVNDGSDEENRQYLKQIMTDYPHVQLVEQNNKGVPAARNAGARVARGVYFTFLDSDDIVKPDYLRACVEALHAHPRAKVAYTRAEFFGARTGEFVLQPYNGFKSLLQGNRFYCTALHRSEDFWRVGGFDESFRTHEDWEYWIRLLQDDNAEVICVPDILFMYRKHDDGSSLIDQLEREPKAIQSDWQRIYEKHRQLYLQYGLGFHDLVASLNKQEEQIKHLGMQVSILEQDNGSLQDTINVLYQVRDFQEHQYQKYKRLWAVTLVKPLIKIEQGLSSVNVYRKGFYILAKEKGSIGKAYQHLRRMRKMNPNEDKPVKRYLRNLVAQKKTGSTVPWHVPAFFDITDTKAYQSWIQRNDTRTEDDFKRMQHEIGAFLHQPLVSILMPVYNVDSKWLILAIDSVRDQVYENWELCISDDASPNPDIRSVLEKYMQLDERIKVVFRERNGHISENSNSALALASGEWLALMDHDDVLPNHALYEVVKAIHKSPDAALIYSDEDKIDEKGRRFMPHFKSDFNLDLLYGQNYISHLGVYRTDIAKAIGGFRKGLEGSQDYDFLLRYLLKIDPSQIIHIPKVLYHWRAIEGSTALSSGEKSYTTEAGVKALQNYFAQLHADVSVGRGKADNLYRVQWNLTYEPLVSLIIPTKNGYEVTKQAIDSILNKTTYAHYEILLVDNNSDDPKALAYFDELSQHEKITVLRYPHPFNYSAINNFAVQHARGEVLGLINNDVEVIDGGWLTEMVSQAMRPDIGCVGAMLYYPNDTIQHAGVVIGINGVAGHSHKHYPKSHLGYFSRLFVAQDLLAVTAACLLLRKTTFDEVGGLNERDLTVAFNDVDLCLKVHKAGYRNLWTPYAELYHHESISRGREDNPEKIARFKREVDYMLNTWHTNTLFDPYYNPNLTIEREDFSISMLSRVDTSS